MVRIRYLAKAGALHRWGILALMPLLAGCLTQPFPPSQSKNTASQTTMKQRPKSTRQQVRTPAGAVVGNDETTADKITTRATQLYRCAGGHTFVVRREFGIVWLMAEGRTIGFKEEEKGMGAFYSDPDGYDLYLNGAKASLRTPMRWYTGCRLDPKGSIWEEAKLDGVDFRAVGNEPPWILEIRGDALTLYRGYDKRATRFRLEPPQIDPTARTTRYRGIGASGERIDVMIEGQACRDSMSGEPFESRVTVRLGGSTLSGCGRALH